MRGSYSSLNKADIVTQREREFDQPNGFIAPPRAVTLSA
jgi:hypothetical protein